MATTVVFLTGGAAAAAAGAMGLEGFGAAVATTTITGTVGGATEAGLYSALMGNDANTVTEDAIKGELLGGAIGAGGYKIKSLLAGRTISYTDYNRIYESSIKNPGKDKIMLGKYDGEGLTSYITKAGNDYTYFSLGSEWDDIKKAYKFTDADMFKLFNESFLDDGINAGKTFYFSHDPIDDHGALGKEFRYLEENGYIWDELNKAMRPE